MSKKQFRQLNPRKIKAEFVLQGTTMRQWAKEQGYPVSSVSMALHGNRKGPQSQKILQRLSALI
jgi:gp16 family phage-associated protein